MPGSRIPSLTAIAGASTANDDNLVIFDTDANTTKRILRSQLAAGLVGDLPYTPAGFVSATTVPTAIAEIASDIAATSGSSLVGYLPAGTGAVARTTQAKLRESVSALDFGAIGDGTTDDAVAIQAAINTGALNVVFPAGYTFLTSPLTTSIVGQKITAYGATIKLKSASSSHLFRALAAGVEVFGGTWDGNNVASRTVLVLSASYCAVRFATVQNCGAAGIYGSTNASYLTIANNVIKDAVTYGIYVEGLTADCYGNKITDNDVDTSGTASAYGIYLTGDNALTYFQRQWIVQGNRVKGSTSTPTGAGITTRAIDGVLSGNTTTGYTLGITADITSRSTISGNRVSDTSGATSYCIEVNADHNSIVGNVTKGGRYGIALSSSSLLMDHNTISANTIEDPTVAGIFVSPGVSTTAKYFTISGNNIDLSGSVTGTIAIRLVRDCAHTHISSNNIRGLGSGTANSRAIYLDTPPAAAHVNISNNKIVGFERAFTAYSAGALTVTDLTSHGNDLSSDVTQSTIGWTFEGSAVVGTRVTHTDSKNSAGSYTDVHDMLLNVFTLRSTTYNNPEGNLAAGIGSLYISLNSGQVPYIKSTGANTNTGWVALA